MQGDEISQYYFENAIGVRFDFRKVNEEERQRILKAYKKWKNTNKPEQL